MSEAIYGLLGALGGTLITAAAGYWGPWRVAQAARQDTYEAAALTRREAEIARIILMRHTTRAWRDHLAQTITTLELAWPVIHEDFDEVVSPCRDAARSALDHALHDGIWVSQTNYGASFRDFSNGESAVMQKLGYLTELVRSEVIRSEYRERAPLEASRAETLKRLLNEVDTARGELSAALLNRLERIMNVEVIGESPAPQLPPGTL
ncbi:hypothetical protein [Streptomyces goshikiensis]|uniref:hypothetical protein n=1 Tax=Streptomyces goshikiensis TaxID=1942 RepID=UPI0036939F7F